MKKINFLRVLACGIAILSLSLQAQTIYEDTEGRVAYRIRHQEDGTAYAQVEYLLDQFNGELVIPETITYNGEKLPVTTIQSLEYKKTLSGDDWETRNGAYIQSISLPSSIRKICSFSACRELSYLTLNNGLEIIAGGAFEDCDDLAEIVIPCSLKQIGSQAFAGCSKLKHFNYLNYHQMDIQVGEDAFADCGDAQFLNFVGTYFDGKTIVSMLDCTGGWTLPKRPQARFQCEAFASQWFNYKDCESMYERYSEIKECQEDWDFEAYSFGSSISCKMQKEGQGTIRVNGSTVDDGWATGFGCDDELMLQLEARPETGYMFVKWKDNCGWEWSDPNIDVQVGGPNHTFTAVFVEAPEFVEFELDGLQYQYISATDELNVIGLVEGATDLIFHGEVTFVPADGIPAVTKKVDAFGNYTENETIESVTFDGVETLEPTMFYRCTNLREAHLEGVHNVSENAFRGAGLQHVYFDESLEMIGMSAFEFCDQLQSLTIGVTESNHAYISDRAFAGCTSLETVDLSYVISEIPASVFEGCTSLKYFYSEDLLYIASRAFANCTNLGFVDVSQVTEFGEEAFLNAGLEGTIELDAAQRIDNNAFSCDKIEAFIIRNVLPEISDNSVPAEAIYYVECELMQTIDEWSPWNYLNVQGLSEHQVTVETTGISADIDCVWVSKLPNCAGVAEVSTREPIDLINPIFNGWFLDGVWVSSDLVYEFTINSDVTLTAEWQGELSPMGIENGQWTKDNGQWTKVLRDGHLYILHNEQMYDVQGQKVQ